MSRERADPSLVVFVRKLAKLLSTLGALVILLITGLGFVGVVMRFVLKNPLGWSDEVIGYLIPVAVMLCAPSLVIDEGNIRIDSLVRNLRGALAAGTHLLMGIAVTLASLLIFISGLEMVLFSISIGVDGPGTLSIPFWILQLCIPAGAFFMTLAAGVKLYEWFAGHNKGEVDAGPSHTQ